MAKTDEVVTTQPMITDNEDTLAGISSFADAMQVLKDAGVEVHSTEEFGDGFSVIDNKDDLVNMPFVVLGMKFALSDKYKDDEGNKAVFAILHVVTESGKKFILTDGGTGIGAQAQKYAAKGITTGLLVPKGLIRSDYETEVNGKVIPGTTYYLS